MAPKELVSCLAVMTSFLVLFLEVPSLESAVADMTFVEAGGKFDHDDSDLREKNLPDLLRVLGFLIDGRHGKRPTLESLAEQTSPSSVASILTAEEANDLTSLLDKLLSPSFRIQEKTNVLSTPRQKRKDEVFRVLTSKRAREHLSGAMPPLNELCRLMGVQCY